MDIGAWRLQIGDRKKAYDDRMRPAGAYGKTYAYYKCNKCNFEGRCTKDAAGKKHIDTKIYGGAGANNVYYRWEFLFKCHVPVKDVVVNTNECHFACIFCCAEGKGTPVFGGLGPLLAHLNEHRGPGREPSGEVLYRVHCALRDSPLAANEAFDVALPDFDS